MFSSRKTPKLISASTIWRLKTGEWEIVAFLAAAHDSPASATARAIRSWTAQVIGGDHPSYRPGVTVVVTNADIIRFGTQVEL